MHSTNTEKLHDFSIIAFDPGAMTGCAWYRSTTALESGKRVALFEAFQCPPKSALDFLASALASLVAKNERVLVVFERYMLQERSHRLSRQNDAQEFIGGLMALCDRMNIPWAAQNASEAKRLGNTQLLKRLNVWTRGQDHANDATKHVLFAIVSRIPSEATELFKNGRIVIRSQRTE